MAGGAGTGLFLIGQCLTCNFEYQEELYFNTAPTDRDIQETLNSAENEHNQQGCRSPLVFGIMQRESYRYDLPCLYKLPALISSLLIK